MLNVMMIGSVTGLRLDEEDGFCFHTWLNTYINISGPLADESYTPNTKANI